MNRSINYWYQHIYEDCTKHLAIEPHPVFEKQTKYLLKTYVNDQTSERPDASELVFFNGSLMWYECQVIYRTISFLTLEISSVSFIVTHAHTYANIRVHAYTHIHVHTHIINNIYSPCWQTTVDTCEAIFMTDNIKK